MKGWHSSGQQARRTRRRRRRETVLKPSIGEWIINKKEMSCVGGLIRLNLDALCLKLKPTFVHTWTKTFIMITGTHSSTDPREVLPFLVSSTLPHFNWQYGWKLISVFKRDLPELALLSFSPSRNQVVYVVSLQHCDWRKSHLFLEESWCLVYDIVNDEGKWMRYNQLTEMYGFTCCLQLISCWSR